MASEMMAEAVRHLPSEGSDIGSKAKHPEDYLFDASNWSITWGDHAAVSRRALGCLGGGPALIRG